MRIALALILVLTATPTLAATGQALFDDQCGGCHTLGPASTPDAPTLKGVVGRKAASLPDFQYSAGLKAKGGVWTEAALEAFLADPQTYAPGTYMFAEVADPAQRQAIVDYLKTAK